MNNTERMRDEVLDSVPVICVLKDAYGAFVYWNDALNQEFELPVDGMQGKTEYHFMADDDAAAIRKNDRHVLRTGELLSATEFTHSPDGSRVAWLVKKFRVTVGNEQFLGVVGGRVRNYPDEADAVEKLLTQHLEICRNRLAEIAARCAQPV